MNRTLTAWIGRVLIPVLWGVACSASPDKSGVSPQSISLPSGPGSIEGLGESFDPQLNSGTFSYRVPLKLPPIRAGAPSLVLEYSSGMGNGMLGLGWQLKFPCVRRQTDKCLPQYVDADLFIDENAEELVHLADGSYRQKIESLFIRYERPATGGWLGRLRNGTVLSFGSADQSRLEWAGRGTFCWLVDASQDPNGNRVEYSYRQDGLQIYPQEIRYGLHVSQPGSFFSVQFGYSTNRPDPFIDCRPRFASTNQLRLQTITVFYGDRRIRHWQLDYDTNAPVSLLTSVTMFGDDRSLTNNLAQPNVDFLPPTHFGYTPFALAAASPVQTIAFDPKQPNFAFGNEDGGASASRAEFVDINHDGLPDILINTGDQWFSLLNPGTQTARWPLAQMIANPPAVTGAGLGRNTTRLVDLRGDGRTKLLIAQSDEPSDAATAFYYYDFKSPTLLDDPRPYTTSNGLRVGDPNVQFLDLDNDKAMDLLATATGPGGSLDILFTREWMGTANQYTNLVNPQDLDLTGGWQLADMNGDRLPDFVRLLDRDNTEVCLNLGWGVFGPRTIMLGGPTAAELQAAGTSGPQLVDLNQDGLADLVMVDNGRVRVWLNVNGQRWADPIELTDGIPAFQTGEDIVRFADMNGNGSVDIVWHHLQDPELHYLDLFPAGKAFLLNHAETALGRTLDLTYRSSTDYMAEAAGTTNQWTVAVPFPVQVIAQTIDGDGMRNLYTNQFSYRNGYYDGLEREFRGFEQATKVELGNNSQGAPTLVTRFQFDTGAAVEALKGKPLRLEAATDAGGVFYRQTNEWTPRPLALAIASNETRSVTFAFQNHKLTQEVELGADTNAVTLEEEFDFDDYGNQIRHADYGRVENGDRSAWDDERVFVHKYSAQFPSGTNLWLLDRLVQEEREDENGVVVARKTIFYDDESFAAGNLGVVTKGNPTLIQEWIGISNNVSRPTLRQRYDAFGNVTDLYDPLGLPGHPERGHYRQVDFDPQIHTHPTRETIYTANPDAIAGGISQPSLVMQAAYDLGLGVLHSSTDFNLNTTMFDFDTFGRLVAITKPCDTTNFPTAVFSYVLQQSVASGRTINFTQSSLRETTGQSGTYDSRSFFDGLGRKIMTRSESDTNGVVIVKGATLFNQRRSTWRSFLPYFESGALDFTPVNQTGPFVESHYDALGRETETSQPPTSSDNYRAFSRTMYGPLTRLLQDEEQTKTDSPHFGAGMRYTEDGLRDKDGHGRLRRVEEIVKLTDDGLPAANTNIWLTQYRHDLLDNFLGYTDSQGNQKEFRYDALSRKLFMNDPDRGVMIYTYDDASNLRSTLDAKSQTISYAYDGVNRLLTEHYRPTNQPPDVTYHYDTPYPNVPIGDGTTATANNTKGMLAWVQDLSGEEHTSYDARGRVEFVVKRIPDPQFLSLSAPGGEGQGEVVLVSYRTAFAYDSLDRVNTLTYPDADFVIYGYNSRNLLNQIVGGPSGSVISNIVYRPSDQLQQIDYGNGVRTTYGYDPRLRLNSLITAPATNPASPLISFSYDFDGVSNIKDIFDNRPGSVVASGDPRRNTQLFAYDDLYRITQAQYSFNAPGATIRNDGQINYRYDRIGNMLAQTSSLSDTDPLTGLPVANLGTMNSGGASGRLNRIGRQPNDPPGPHALSQIVATNAQTRNYPYDANGNMTVIDDLTNTWDFKDRLVVVENSRMRAQYTYDYTDRRVMKRVWPKAGSFVPRGREGQSVGATNSQAIAVLYIDKYFEVRDHDAPTKYVWNGNTRVARVTGSLNTNIRLQRLRLWPGWNLLSLAVTTAASAFSLQPSALRWEPNTLSWLPVSPKDILRAGAVLWLQATTNASLTIAGTYANPTNQPVTPGPNFLPVPGFEPLSLTNSIVAPLSAIESFWSYAAAQQVWETQLPTALSNLNTLLPTLSPGEALFVHADDASELPAPDATLQIRYYHQDHLGSSSVFSDRGGQLVEETANYPFGQPRHELKSRHVCETYKFTQKEQDEETGLLYLEARFLCGQQARFASWDRTLSVRHLQPYPQALNGYSYCKNRPLTLVDPSGNEDQDPSVPNQAGRDHSQVTGEKQHEGENTMSKGKKDSLEETSKTIGENTIWVSKEGTKGFLDYAAETISKDEGKAAAKWVSGVRFVVLLPLEAAELRQTYKEKGGQGVCEKIVEIAGGKLVVLLTLPESGLASIGIAPVIEKMTQDTMKLTGTSEAVCKTLKSVVNVIQRPDTIGPTGWDQYQDPLVGNEGKKPAPHMAGTPW